MEQQEPQLFHSFSPLGGVPTEIFRRLFLDFLICINRIDLHSFNPTVNYLSQVTGRRVDFQLFSKSRILSSATELHSGNKLSSFCRLPHWESSNCDDDTPFTSFCRSGEFFTSCPSGDLFRLQKLSHQRTFRPISNEAQTSYTVVCSSSVCEGV